MPETRKSAEIISEYKKTINVNICIRTNRMLSYVCRITDKQSGRMLFAKGKTVKKNRNIYYEVDKQPWSNLVVEFECDREAGIAISQDVEDVIGEDKEEVWISVTCYKR